MNCTVAGCGKAYKAHGLCAAHYARLRRTGSLGTTPIADQTVRTQEERFWDKVDKRGPSECWPWTGALTSTGYGALRPAGQRTGPAVKAHRYSAELAGMDIAGRFVLHSCDNPSCVNPGHLRVGSHVENMQDMVSRGRHAGFRKITPEQADEIRAKVAAGALHREVAEEYGVSRPTITRTVAVTPPAARDLVSVVADALGAAA